MWNSTFFGINTHNKFTPHPHPKLHQEQKSDFSWELATDVPEITCPSSPPALFHHQLPEEDDTS